MKDYMLDAAVVLRRNYADLPFDAMNSEETARRVNERAMGTTPPASTTAPAPTG